MAKREYDRRTSAMAEAAKLRRVRVSALRKSGKTVTQIAEAEGVSLATVSKDMRANEASEREASRVAGELVGPEVEVKERPLHKRNPLEYDVGYAYKNLLRKKGEETKAKREEAAVMLEWAREKGNRHAFMGMVAKFMAGVEEVEEGEVKVEKSDGEKLVDELMKGMGL